MKLRLIGIVALVAMFAALVPVAAAHADDEGDSSETQLEGVVEILPPSGLVGDWTVSGTIVHVTDTTEIEQEDAAVALGATVEVEGVAETDLHITASKVEVKEAADDDEFGQVEFEGTVDVLPCTTPFVCDWTVSGVTVHVTSATEIEQENGLVALGAAVEVKGLAEADGSITASKIEVKDAADIEDGSLTLTGTASVLPKTAARTGDWRVSKHTVHVRAATRIVHARLLSRGSNVRVFGTLRPDGSIRASKVVVRG